MCFMSHKWSRKGGGVGGEFAADFKPPARRPGSNGQKISRKTGEKPDGVSNVE
jgi:hypothetical protein